MSQCTLYAKAFLVCGPPFLISQDTRPDASHRSYVECSNVTAAGERDVHRGADRVRAVLAPLPRILHLQLLRRPRLPGQLSLVHLTINTRP